MIVVIDGPAGSGKSSTAKAVASKLKIQFLDSGALYRAVTLIFLNCDRNYEEFFNKLKAVEITFRFEKSLFRVFLNRHEITDQLRSMNVSEYVSEIASNADVRAFVNNLMRRVVQNDIYIADGRDLGTAVFPDADLKFFMVADLKTRAERRLKEIQQDDANISIEDVMKNISKRDEADSNRAADPLKKADDAITVDTSNMNFDEQVHFISDKIKEKLLSQEKP